ncbi:AraC family transcriptional regulator [Actinoplanes sp. RD1]|uniref:AraC family transcriptional regulator n=1 Tax=Actinoplanes sp. RD1 TaxID=3064538 RepID=UPI002742121D|nr:AraC family transcriptional regulator [Actinoplanes sp. RD1]
MAARCADNGGSSGGMRQNSVLRPPHARVTRATGAQVRGAPVVGFTRAPGVPPVAVVHLPDRPPAGLALPADQAHTHDFLVLFYAHRAHGSVAIDGRTWEVRDGDLFVLAPGQVVSFGGPGHEVADDGWAMFFPADAPGPSWQGHPLLLPFTRGAGHVQRLRVPAGERAGWVARFRDLDAELRTRRDGYQEAALALLTLVLVAATRLTGDVAGDLRAAGEPVLAAVFELIERRFHEPISLADIAAEVALTPGHLTTVVRRSTGRTVQQWLTERRMQHARHLLAGTDLTVAAISRRAGYPDVSYFIKRFRADHGLTPARWRAAGGPGARRVTPPRPR